MSLRFVIPNVASDQLLEWILHGNIPDVWVSGRRNNLFRLECLANGHQLAMMRSVLASVLGEEVGEIAPDDVDLAAEIILHGWLIQVPDSQHSWFACRELGQFPMESVLDRLIEGLAAMGADAEFLAEGDSQWPAFVGG